MYTQCPSCATVFVVTSEQLQLAEGEARCGLCSEVFSALDSLVHELPAPQAAPAAAPQPEPEPEPPPRKTHRERSARAAVDWVERVLGLEADAHEESGRRSLRQAGYALAAVLLVIVAVGQYGYFNSAALADGPARPYIETLCAAAGCPVPARRAPGRIAIAGRAVRSHPTVEGALLVEATLANQAGFAQPLPQVRLRLRALNGRVTGERWFAPDEYLASSRLADSGSQARLPPGGRVDLRLEVMEPSGDAQGFEFDFR